MLRTSNLKSLAAVSLLWLLLCGMMSCGPRPRNNEMLSLSLVDPAGDHILASDQAVDYLAARLSELLHAQGFENPRPSKSFGLQPWTGHTQNLWAVFQSNQRIYVYASISKCCIEVSFHEMETGIGTDEYSASPSDREAIGRIWKSIGEFLREAVK